MKLYATVTSERATKGQGGNDSLDIRLSVSNDRIEAGRIIVEPSGTGYKVYFIPPAGITKADGVTLSEITAEYIEIKKKGERQKGERTPENIAKWLVNGEHDKLQEKDYIKD